jgi:hypothetical protein
LPIFVCKVNSDELQHFYINVRAVNIDVEKKEINESLCRPGLSLAGILVNCKFEILDFLDEPCEYINISQYLG